MSTSLPSTSNPHFQPILEKALNEYKKKTKKDLIIDPLAEEIRGCDSPEAILSVLEGKANELNRSQSSDERLIKWLTPTVNVLNALSATLGQGIGTIFPPTQIIFSGISILLVAARDTAASREALIELFDKIENFFVRLQTYTEVPPAAAITNVMGKIMAEVLCMLAIATKEMKQRRTKTFLKKLIGRKDIEDALQRLDKLEQGELRTVTAQVLKTTCNLKDVTSDLKDDAEEIKLVVQQIVSDMTSHECQQLLRDLLGWLTPPDPSTNYNNACGSQHEGTSVWVFREEIYKKWEASGSLLWIHGKAGSGKSILCSAIIQQVITLRNAGLASVAYYYFDFRDVDKKHRRGLLSSLLIQLSSRSGPCLSILSRLYSAHNDGKEQPSERVLVQCLKDMLSAPSQSQLPTYVILDALDECPNTSGMPTPRGHVLGLVRKLVDLGLPSLRICVTSRPEIDIRMALEPLTSDHLSIHDQRGQEEDILEYVSSVVQSDPQMQRWREDDRRLVVETLSEKADGMFRWVFCQLEMLRHCLAPSLRRQLNQLPASLDETYERVLKEIESTGQGRHARRLLRCLAVAMRPLQVEELAEVLSFDLDVAEGEIPRFHPEWRWKDQEQAVLSACSSLVTVINGDNSRVIQFSHFSVKEYLTSDRLAIAIGDVSRYHIVSEPAHLVLARACHAALLYLEFYVNEECNETNDDGGNKSNNEHIPLFKYAAEHWTSHAQVGNVSSILKDTTETLFDLNKPYYLEWIQIHDTGYFNEHYWVEAEGQFRPRLKAKPLYYAALCGFYELVHHLTVKHPEQVNDRGGNHAYPLVAALSRNYLRVAELLLEHGAHAHVRGDPPLCRAIEFSDDARVDSVQLLLRHGACVNAGQRSLRTPLHFAAHEGCPEVARILLDRGADVHIWDNRGQVPLHLVSNSTTGQLEGKRSIVTRLLLEHGADVNALDNDHATPLHFASSHGRLEITQLLLHHGAKANVENIHGQTLLHMISQGEKFSHDNPNLARLLLGLGLDVNAEDKDQANPLHFACSHGNFETALVLLDHGANVNAQNSESRTPLHCASQDSKNPSDDDPRVARLMLEHGGDVNARDKDQATPLHLASNLYKLDTAQVLLDHGADANAQNVDGQTPIHQASSSLYSYSHIVQLLVERGADVNALDKDQETPLHIACSHGNCNVALALLNHGAELSPQNADGQTPLHRISQRPRCFAEEDVVRLLLERGMDVNARDKAHQTPLHLAASKSWPEIVQVLLDHGAMADVRDADGQTPLHRVSQWSGNSRSVNVVLRMLEHTIDLDVNARDKDQETPLHLASYYLCAEVVKVLLDHGAQVNAEDNHGQTPLHQLVLGNHNYRCINKRWSWWHSRAVHTAQLLLERGADINAQNERHEIPLHLASRLLLHELARFLLKHGADVDMKNSEGRTPFQLAPGRKGKAMRRLLLEYSGKQAW